MKELIAFFSFYFISYIILMVELFADLPVISSQALKALKEKFKNFLFKRKSNEKIN
jgi:hypothetical protein